MENPKNAKVDSLPNSGIIAAGGIVLGFAENAGKIALVQRRRYLGEIGLPKGKLTFETDETSELAAIREVREETGLSAEIFGYAGSTHYFVGEVPKVVFYFMMRAKDDAHPIEDVGEIEAVQWRTPKEAILSLTHREDRELVSAVFCGVVRSE